MATGFLGNATLIVGLVIQNPRKGNAADGFTFENGFREVDEIYVRPADLGTECDHVLSCLHCHVHHLAVPFVPVPGTRKDPLLRRGTVYNKVHGPVGAGTVGPDYDHFKRTGLG